MATTRRTVIAAGAALALGTSFRAAAQGGGKAGHDAKAVKPEQKSFGIAGDPKRVSRTVDVAMSDDMRFTPSTLDVREGETLRLRLKNRGKVMHELVIGTQPELEAHAELMKKFPGMEHDAPWMAHVAPGKSGAIVWNFNRAGQFKYACLIAGHFAAGMVGTVTVA